MDLIFQTSARNSEYDRDRELTETFLFPVRKMILYEESLSLLFHANAGGMCAVRSRSFSPGGPPASLDGYLMSLCRGQIIKSCTSLERTHTHTHTKAAHCVNVNSLVFHRDLRGCLHINSFPCSVFRGICAKDRFQMHIWTRISHLFKNMPGFSLGLGCIFHLDEFV